MKETRNEEWRMNNMKSRQVARAPVKTNFARRTSRRTPLGAAFRLHIHASAIRESDEIGSAHDP
jgi:hypothetical protein